MHPAVLSHTTAAFRSNRQVSACLLAVSALLLLAGCSGTATNPPAPVETANTSAATVSSNPQIDWVLEYSCFDCHSDHNSAPWNARLAPSYSFAASKAREALYFSD